MENIYECFRYSETKTKKMTDSLEEENFIPGMAPSNVSTIHWIPRAYARSLSGTHLKRGGQRERWVNFMAI